MLATDIGQIGIRKKFRVEARHRNHFEMIGSITGQRPRRGRTDNITFSVFFVLLLNLESDFQTSIFETTEKYEK